MNKRVVITGLGVVSSIGIGKDEFWSALLQGKSGISSVTAFDTSRHFTHNGGQTKNFKPQEFLDQKKNKDSRASELALAATRLAIKDANISASSLNEFRVGLCVGTTMGSVQTVEIINEITIVQKNKVDETFIHQTPTHTTPASVAQKINLSGPSMMFSTACAAGNYAIGYGFDLINFGRADIILAGGTEPFSKVAFTGFNQFSAIAPDKCQPFDKNRKGMIPGEGAGVVVLESLEHAYGRNAHIYAEVLGYGLSCDGHHMTNASIEGIAWCMKNALKSTNLTPDDIDYISAHGTGTPTNDKHECAAIKEVFGARSQQIPISSIKSMLGHTMGAASAIEAVACALVLKNNMIPPTINFETADPDCDIDCVPNKARKQRVNILLNNSYAFGGNNASLVLKKFF